MLPRLSINMFQHILLKPNWLLCGECKLLLHVQAAVGLGKAGRPTTLHTAAAFLEPEAGTWYRNSTGNQSNSITKNLKPRGNSNKMRIIN